MFWLYLFILYIVFIVYCLWSVTPANGIKVIDKCSVDTMLITNCLEICHLPFQNQSYFENLFYETDIPSHSSSVRTQTGMHPGKTGKNGGVPGNGSCPWITGTARGGTGTFSQRAPNPGVIKETTTHTPVQQVHTHTSKHTHIHPGNHRRPQHLQWASSLQRPNPWQTLPQGSSSSWIPQWWGAGREKEPS